MKSISLIVVLFGIANAFVVYQHLPKQAYSSFEGSVLRQMLTVASKHGLSGFPNYVQLHPEGSVADFAASLGYNDFPETFQNYIQEHKKEYSADEAAWRQVMLLASLQKINKHNSEGHSWEMGLTPFADWTESEFEAILLKGSPEPYHSNESTPNIESMVFADHFDWRSSGKVAPIEHQLSCPSCWSFSVGVTVETQWALKKNTPVKPVSKQEMVDCLVGGCTHGYWPHDVYSNYLKSRGGKFVSQASYPYDINHHSCHFTGDVAAQITSYKRLGNNAPDAELMNAIQTFGPISVTLNAGQFSLYKRGTIFDTNCPAGTNHAVALVGWGTENGRNFWILRNSWGTGWGEDGYMKIAREHNMCGMNNIVVYPIV